MGALALVAVMAAIAATVTDRGLPDQNLNNIAGADRSNVAWSFGTDWMTGDDFTVGADGETWVVTQITTWQVAGDPGAIEFGDRYSDASLYVGPADPGGVSLVATGAIAVGSSVNSNPDITHEEVTYDDIDQPNYDSFGNSRQVWETTFTGLSIAVDGGVKYNFAVDGNVTSPSFNWFNHASNAALSGTPQEGADDLYLAWDKAALFAAPFACDSGDATNCGGWDKSSDINVLVTAVQVATEGGTCKNGGWQSLVKLDGSAFKNQGDCVSYAQNGR